MIRATRAVPEHKLLSLQELNDDKMKIRSSILTKIFRFYYDGFRTMSDWGRKVWLIILIKLFIMFVILRLFFFRDFLDKKFDTERQKSEYVMDQLINSH